MNAIMYIYDIDAKDRKHFNRTKRWFYYNIKKIESVRYLTKSTIFVDSVDEEKMDILFKKAYTEKRPIKAFKIRLVEVRPLCP